MLRVWFVLLFVALTTETQASTHNPASVFRGDTIIFDDKQASEEQGTAVEVILAQLKEGLNQEQVQQRRISLKRTIAQSHCPRPQHYKSKGKGEEEVLVQQVDISTCNKLLRLRTVDGRVLATVGASMSMHKMVEALLPLGYIPAIVPEFKGITVGGSIQGLAAESTSFRYGLYHDAVPGFEAITADGSVLWCSKDSNSDLFYGLPGSFGSLAICTQAGI
jgi:hypothetical protein